MRKEWYEKALDVVTGLMIGLALASLLGAAYTLIVAIEDSQHHGPEPMVACLILATAFATLSPFPALLSGCSVMLRSIQNRIIKDEEQFETMQEASVRTREAQEDDEEEVEEDDLPRINEAAMKELEEKEILNASLEPRFAYGRPSL
jgi:hypothetical protein